MKIHQFCLSTKPKFLDLYFLYVLIYFMGYQIDLPKLHLNFQLFFLKLKYIKKIDNNYKTVIYKYIYMII